MPITADEIDWKQVVGPDGAIVGGTGEVIAFEARGAVQKLFASRAEEAILAGAAGCVAGETELWDYSVGRSLPIAAMCRAGHAPIVSTLWGPVQAAVPFLKGTAALYRVRLRSGRSFLATGDHRVLSAAGWLPLALCSSGTSILVSSRAPTLKASGPSPSVSPPGALHSTRTAPGSPARCSIRPRPDGEPPHGAPAGDPVPPPSQAGARARTHDDLPLGAAVGESAHSAPFPACAPPSTMDCSPPLGESRHTESPCLAETCSPSGALFPTDAPSRITTTLLPPILGPLHGADNTRRHAPPTGESPLCAARPAPAGATPPGPQLSSSCSVTVDTTPLQLAAALQSDVYNLSCFLTSKCHYMAQWDQIEAVDYERTDDYYDLHVPGAEHYLAEGVWHHNTGKSRGVLEFVHYLLANFPEAKALVLRKTLVSLTESGLQTYKRDVLHHLDGVRFYGGSKAESARFIYPNGSTLTVGGLDNPTKVMSTEYDIIFVQEATEISLDDHEQLTTRLRNGKIRMANGFPFHLLVEDCNPSTPWHWILTRVREGKLLMLDSRHEDNPRFFNADGTKTPDGVSYMARLDAMTGVRYQRLRLGRWVSAEGTVYESFDPAIHVIPRFKIPADWRRIRAIDFGFVNPLVCLWFGLSPDQRLYCYREIYRTQRIVADHAKRIKQLSGTQRFVATVADHDAEDRATLHENGIYTIRAKKAIIPGIEAVQELLRVGEDGKPRLYFFNDILVDRETRLFDMGLPTSVLEEFLAYVWASEDDQRRSHASSRTPKELPIDMDNHGLDALRYAAMYIKRRGKLVGPGGKISGKSKWFGAHSMSG